MFGSFRNYYHKEGQRAFSLVELLVALTIMTIVTTVVLARHQSFNGAVLLRNQAYDVAFTIRQAQQLAVSASSGTSDPSLRQSYGVHVDITNNTYHIFQDVNLNGLYEDATDTVVGPVKKLDPRFNFRSALTCCGGGGQAQAVQWSLAVTFVRPNFDAYVRRNTEHHRKAGPHYINIAIAGSNDADLSPNVVKRVEILNSGNVSVVNY